VKSVCAAPAPLAMTNRDAWIGLVAWSMDAGARPRGVYAAMVARQSMNDREAYQALLLRSCCKASNTKGAPCHTLCMDNVSISSIFAEVAKFDADVVPNLGGQISSGFARAVVEVAIDDQFFLKRYRAFSRCKLPNAHSRSRFCWGDRATVDRELHKVPGDGTASSLQTFQSSGGW
jgi:hypothetical protein